jgi:hypothetical protein
MRIARPGSLTVPHKEGNCRATGTATPRAQPPDMRPPQGNDSLPAGTAPPPLVPGGSRRGRFHPSPAAGLLTWPQSQQRRDAQKPGPFSPSGAGLPCFYCGSGCVSAELSPLASGGLAGGSGVVRLALGAQALTCGQISESLRSIDLASVMSHRLVEVAVLRIQVPVVGSRGCSSGLLRAMLKDIEIVLAILMRSADWSPSSSAPGPSG